MRPSLIHPPTHRKESGMSRVFCSKAFWLILTGIAAGALGFWTGDKSMYLLCTTALTLGGICIYFDREDRLQQKKPEVTMDGRQVKYVSAIRPTSQS